MKVFIGFDERECAAYEVAEKSLLKHSPNSVAVPIILEDCQKMGLYTRPFEYRDGKPFDPISDAPMSTQFALSRFLIPWLHTGKDQWVLFIDVDMMFRTDVDELMQYADDKYAVVCVQHCLDHGDGVKMDGCKQSNYNRKNWSSVVLWNTKHEAHKRLTLDMFNSLPGRDLHQFCWLNDDEIGAMPMEWNFLAGYYPEPKILHYTLGTPNMEGYEDSFLANEWWSYLE